MLVKNWDREVENQKQKHKQKEVKKGKKKFVGLQVWPGVKG